MILAPDELDAIRRQAVEEYPNECCGVVMVRGRDRQVVRCRNIQDELHALDPVRHPRTARTAFNIGKDDHDRIASLQAQGFELAVIYHSHVDVGAYFSETDRRMAMMGQDPRRHDPLYPDVTHVVMAVTRDGVEQVNAFRWNPTTRDFPPVEPGVTVPSERGA
ncbi:MAG TPA: Mov34/MPN/PAD-1 family protein [Methylomirabilota bacterium]|nr:Mov34/MPN/PAD-1 family protein [Methylomirabilota bacterium]